MTSDGHCELANKAPSGKRSALDPLDWDEFRRLSHEALDELITYMATIEERPVWQAAPADVVARFRSPIPYAPSELGEVLGEIRASIQPYVTGNGHPLFMGWVHGAGTPVGMLGEMLAAGFNANCGGRNHIGLEVERQITLWMAELFGFPRDASGVFTTGTSMANFLAVIVARTAVLGKDIRRRGVGDNTVRLTAYASAEVHGCIVKAMELAGLGSANLRRVPVDSHGAIRTDLLVESIKADRREGRRPFMLVGTAGSADTGAFDDLSALAVIAEGERLWFHVDGAFGALLTMVPALRYRVAGIERSSSVAFDFHKWAHVPYDAGFLIVRDPEAHRCAFVSEAAYLAHAPRGLAAGDAWPCDLGVDLSRGFRALKTWITLRVHGVDRLGESIARCCEVARYLEDRIRGLDGFEVVSPARSNIVCFSHRSDTAGARNKRLVMDLHENGVAAPSTTTIEGRVVVRCAIVNHRTTKADIDRFVEAVFTHAAACCRESGA